MRLFNRKKIERTAVANESHIEVIAHQEATKREINHTKQVNKKLNNLLEANGFTLKIYLAAGGHRAESTTTRKKTP